MKITKHFLNEALKDTVEDFNSKVAKIGNEVTIEFIDKNDFMKDVKANPLIQQQIHHGFYKNIDKEYPNFLVVYERNKNPLMLLLGLPYKISVCLEMAKDILKPYPKNEVKAYLKHGFAHEIAHIVEDSIINNQQELWNKCMERAYNNEAMAKELLVEDIADIISDGKLYKKVLDDVWSGVKYRTDKIRTK